MATLQYMLIAYSSRSSEIAAAIALCPSEPPLNM